MQLSSNLTYLSKRIRDPKDGWIIFAWKVLGIPVIEHKGQMRWLLYGKKRINILKPGNRFGKSLITAIKHLYHGFTKICISGMYNTTDEWKRINYNTLNFGPGYEQAREILLLARDIAEGNIHIPPKFQGEYGVTNRSLLKGWFIVNDQADKNNLPYLEFASGVKLLGRSYSDMGTAFKAKGIVYISGDECGDVDEIWTFTNNTLLPRILQYRNAQIDYVGTMQADGYEYQNMIDMADEDMARADWKVNGKFYVQKGSLYENPFLDEDTVRDIEEIADENLKRQFIYGERVETGTKYFGYKRVQNAVSKVAQFLKQAESSHKYLVSCDFAGGESVWADFTVIMVVDVTQEPYEVRWMERFKGGDVPIPVQYQLVREIFQIFNDSGAHAKLIIDSSALGGKNALAFLKDMKPIEFDMNPKPKAEMLATLKIAFDGGQSQKRRRKLVVVDDVEVEENPEWGLIQIPDVPETQPLINELRNYKLEDKRIRTDCVMTLGMAIHYQEMRRPKPIKSPIRDFDLAAIS